MKPQERMDFEFDDGSVISYVIEHTCEITAFDDGLDESYDGSLYSYAPPTYYLSCGHNAYEYDPNYCPVCGAKVVE